MDNTSEEMWSSVFSLIQDKSPFSVAEIFNVQKMTTETLDILGYCNLNVHLALCTLP